MSLLYAGGVLFVVLLTQSLSLHSHQVLSKLLEAVGVTGATNATIAGCYILNAESRRRGGRDTHSSGYVCENYFFAPNL